MLQVARIQDDWDLHGRLGVGFFPREIEGNRAKWFLSHEQGFRYRVNCVRRQRNGGFHEIRRCELLSSESQQEWQPVRLRIADARVLRTMKRFSIISCVVYASYCLQAYRKNTAVSYRVARPSRRYFTRSKWSRSTFRICGNEEKKTRVNERTEWLDIWHSLETSTTLSGAMTKQFFTLYIGKSYTRCTKICS